MAEEWQEPLQTSRERLGLSRAGVARRASLSTETVRAYEEGRRRPTRASLTAILDALKLERRDRNAILTSAGFAPDGIYLGPQNPDYVFTRDEAAALVERLAWPAFVAGEFLEVIAANRVAQKLWGVDLSREFLSPFERNLLAIASNPRFADKCVNWDEPLKVMIAVFKGHHLGPEQLEAPSPQFEVLLQEFLKGDQRYVNRFLDLWDETPPADAKVRWHYPIVWEEPDIGRLRFDCFVTGASEPDGLAFNDWIPLDAATWQALDTLTKRR